jgi:lysophospholipase L1-like esterase
VLLRALRTSPILLVAFLAVGAAVLPACSNTPVQPTQIYYPPRAVCPAPVTRSSPTAQPVPVTYPPATVEAGFPPTTVACAPASGSVFPVGVTAVTCTATDHINRASSCSFSLTVVGPPHLSVTRFVAFGDSITWGEDGTNAETIMTVGRLRPFVQFPASDTYPGVLQMSLSALYTAQFPQVANQGKPGEAVTDPATFSRFVSVTPSSQYDVVLLMEGANDLGAVSTQASISGLGQMIDSARSRGLTVMLATITPRNPSGSKGANAGLVAPFNDQVRTLAISKGVPLVDVYVAFGGDLSLLSSDGLHPTKAGYKRIADTFFSTIRQTLEGPAPVASSASPARGLSFSVPPRRR